MKKINNIIEKNIKKILIIFLFIQPIIDVLTALSLNYFNINITISSIIRLCFLILCIYYLIALNKTKNKKVNIIYILTIITYILIFVITTLIYKDKHALTYEIKNTLNTFYFPIILIAFKDMFKQYNIKIELKYIIYTYILYIIFIIIPNITNTGFASYSESKLGNIGWFYSANNVGNILSITLPLIIYYIINKKKKILTKIILITSILYVFASIGTKVPILSLLICIIGNLIHYILKWIKNKNYKNIQITLIGTIITLLISIIIIPKTTFYKNIQIHKEYLGINNYIDILTNYDLIDHFIFSQRLTFLKNTKNNYKQSHILEKINGIGYIENYATDKISTKTIEIDYFDIIYRHGIGTIIYSIIFIQSLIEIIKKLKEKTLLKTEYKISITIIMLLALFSGHVLVTPTVSIYVALIFTTILTGGLNEKINQR